jgi:hypothetical protein
VAVTDAAVNLAHQQRGCYGCLIPGHTGKVGWPVPRKCAVLVTELVECRATASAAEDHHHWDCTFWEHYPEETPF